MKAKFFLFQVISVLSLVGPSAHGAGKFTVQTDANGNFINTPLGTATWSGNGTVTPNITGATSVQNIVSGTSGGTFSPGNFAMTASDPANYLNGDRSNTGIGMTITISVTGANASFNFGGRSYNTANGQGGWENFQITNMQNVQSMTVSYTFTDPIAAVRGSNNTTAPFLVGMRQAAGTGTYNAVGTIANLTVDNAPYSITNHPNADFMELGSAVWNNSTAVGTISNLGASPEFHGFMRLDIDGDGFVEAPTNATSVDEIVQEIERTYATGMTWTINSNDTTFSNGSEFFFSFNGVQYLDTIPEPSAMFLSALGLCGAAFYRNRRKR